ncbi:MAG: gas vesicle protein K [Chloroherpetonaceae bacterium]|nr:gas vesicle protein K [Chloroherpetonaceae bacterium]
MFGESSQEELAEKVAPNSNGLPKHLNLEPENVEQGLGQLVLTLVEILRQVLERQALRRMESGTLSEEEIERLGLTLMKLERKNH